MGLDWELVRPARAGHEREVAELRQWLERDSEPRSCLLELLELLVTPVAFPYLRHQRRVRDAERERVVTRLGDLTIAPGEAIGAPRVGIDAAATEWFRELVERNRKEIAEGPGVTQYFRLHWTQPLDALVRQYHGRYVLELGGYDLAAPVSLLGSPTSCTPGAVTASYDIPGSLQSEGVREHDAVGMKDYADRLETALLTALKGSVSDLTDASNDAVRSRCREAAVIMRQFSGDAYWAPEREGLRRLDDADQVFQVIAWLRFWSARGFGFRPDA